MNAVSLAQPYNLQKYDLQLSPKFCTNQISGKENSSEKETNKQTGEGNG